MWGCGGREPPASNAFVLIEMLIGCHEATDSESFAGAERMARVKKARCDLRVVVAACIGVQAYLRPAEPDQRKVAIASYKSGVKAWIDSDAIVLYEPLVKFLEAYVVPWPYVAP